MEVSRHGFAVLFDNQQHSLALPERVLGDNQAADRPAPALMSSVLQSQHPVLVTATQDWLRQGHPDHRLASSRLPDGTIWFHQFRNLSLGDERIWLSYNFV